MNMISYFILCILTATLWLGSGLIHDEAESLPEENTLWPQNKK